MYSSRKTKVRFAKGGVVSGGLAAAGLSLGLTPDPASTKPILASPVPPSPVPPSPLLEDERESVESELCDEYTQHAKQQAKTKLESITGRLFQVLNDFEDNNDEDQLRELDLQERNNIQSMITGYRDTCTEREDLLTSLAEWFDDDHIETMLEDIHERRVSLAANPDGLKASLLEGKQTSLKLKAINERILSAENRGLNTEQLKLEKEELEKKLMTKINLVDEIEGVHDESTAAPNKTISTAVTDSWKFAAVEICNMLHQVRDSGSEELHELDGKIQQLVDTMNQQTQVIEQLNAEIQQQRQMAIFSEQTTVKLSNDNSLLSEEVEMLRGQLLEAKHTISTLQADLHKMELKAEFESKRATAANQKTVALNKNRPNSTALKKATEEMATDDSKYEAQISDLCMEVATLSQENNELKLAVETVEREFDDARAHFEVELERYRTELEHLQMLQLSSVVPTDQQPTTDQHPTVCMETSEAGTPGPVQQSTILAKEAPTEKGAAVSLLAHSKWKSSPIPAQSDTSTNSLGFVDRRKSSVSGKEVQLLQIKLLDKDNQLQKAQENIVRLQAQVQALDSELQSMRKENDGLMKLQEKSAALIGQASTCLQIKSEQKQSNYNIPSPHELSATQGGRVQSGKQQIRPTPVVHQASDHLVNVEGQLVTMETRGTREQSEQHAQSEDTPHYWSVVGSMDNGERKFGMPEERSDEEKKAESLQLVVKLIEQVNENEMDFATADSKALQKVQVELQKICQLVTRFLEYSSNLVNDEAEVMSSAMDSLMSHLPDDEKKNLPRQNTNGRQAARMSIAEVKYTERNKLKEKVVRFADQAIGVLKAGEKALTTKINAQKKDLQDVLTAMTDHKQRQSVAFKFTPPDLKDLMPEAHGVSTHSISTRQSHLIHPNKSQTSDPSGRRRALIERLRQYSQPQGNSSFLHAPSYSNYDISTYGAFKGLGSSLFMVNNRGQQPHPQRGTLEMGTGRGSQRPATDGRTFLQINATHVQEDRERDTQSHSQWPSPESKHMSTALSHKRKRPKLYKPFHFQSPLSAEPPSTASKAVPVAKTTLQPSRGSSRSNRRQSIKADTVNKKSNMVDTDGTTFFDLLSHSNTISKRSAPSGDSQSLKLPPLSQL